MLHRFKMCSMIAVLLLLAPVCLVMAQPYGGDTVEPPAGEEGGIGFGMNGAVGATVINGETYQSFSLRPELAISKIGIGLDLTFYFDADGNLREEDWDEGADFINKIYYIRYGHPGETVYARVGAIDNLTLGYGLIMRRYSNAIEWPQVRRIGLHAQVNPGPLGVEALVNNFREIDTPGLVAGRVTYELNAGLPIVFGATFAHDGNQYLGAKDDDDDGVPDPFDQFPGENDDDRIADIEGLLDPADIDSLIHWGILPDINNPPQKIDDMEEDVSIWGVDIGVPLISTERMNLIVYAQMAQIVDYGRGYTLPGVGFTMGPFRASAEYRIFESEFMPEFFGLGYEVERVVWNTDSNAYYTKESMISNTPSAMGFYIDAGMTIHSLIDVYAAYQDMTYGDPDDDQVEVEDVQAVYALATLNTDAIPKVGLAQAYYHQPNATDLFNTMSDGTVLGYRIGFEMSQGMMVVLDKRTVYRDNKPNRIMTIETVFRF